MAMKASAKLMTAEDLWSMPDDEYRYDLLRGELERMSPVTRLHVRIQFQIAKLLDAFVDERGLGEVYGGEAGYQLERNPDTVLSPDVSFVVAERLPEEYEEGFAPFAPDLAVEVLSPSNRPGRMSRKVRAYLATGVSQVWVVDPRRRTVTIHQPGSPEQVLRDGDIVDGGALLPGLRMRVSEIFHSSLGPHR